MMSTWVGLFSLVGLVALTGLILGAVAISNQQFSAITATLNSNLTPGDSAPANTYFNVSENGKVWKINAYFKYKGSPVGAAGSTALTTALSPPPSSLLTTTALVNGGDITTGGALVFGITSAGVITMYNPTGNATIATNDLISINSSFTTN